MKTFKGFNFYLFGFQPGDLIIFKFSPRNPILGDKALYNKDVFYNYDSNPKPIVKNEKVLTTSQ